MSGNSIDFDNKKIKISELYKNKEIFNIDGIDVDKSIIRQSGYYIIILLDYYL